MNFYPKNKVIYVITKTDYGGAQKYINDLSNNLDKNKFETKMFFGGTDIKWLVRNAYPWLLFLPDWLAIFEIATILKHEMPDMVHLNSSKAGFIGALSAIIANFNSTKKIKVVFTAHGWVFNPTNELNPLVRYFYIFLHKIAALCTDKIICVSEYDYKLAIQYKIAPKNKLIAIHNGIDNNIKFLDKKTARKEIFNKLTTCNPQLKANHNYPWVGSIGRLTKEKNYETFINAAKLIPNAYFFIIGSGPEINDRLNQIKRQGLENKFFLIKPEGEDYKFLKALDIFVMSSIKEGLPYLLLETMIAEIPIVTTEAGGIPEIIKDHENGLMVAQKNPEAMANAIKGLLINKKVADELKITAKRVIQEKFDLKQMIAKTESIYKEIL